MRHRRFFWLSLSGLCAAGAIVFSAAAQNQDLEEIVVTGTYIRRQSQRDSPSALVSIARQDLAMNGANEVGRILEDLTINTGSQNNPDAFTQNLTTGTSNVNLRGLGVNSSLVLINGRRQTPSAAATDRGENFVDTSSLPPMIAVERIEILKDGATALYGSEAVTGVVNFITRSAFQGFDLELGVQKVDAYGQQDQSISGLYGVGNDRTHVLVAFHHLDRDPLSTAHRRLSGPTDDLSQAGNPGSFLVPSRPGNPVFQSIWTGAFDHNRNGVADFVEGQPQVPGARPPVFADQDCAAVAAQDPNVVPNFTAVIPSTLGAIPIGLCEFDFGGFYSIVPDEQRSSAYLALTHDLSDAMQGRFELHTAHNKALRDNSPSFPFTAFPTIAANHPDNPYGSDVRFIGRAIGAGGAAVQSIHDSATRRLAGSLKGSIGATWTWEAGAQLSTNDFFVAAPDVLIDRFYLALAGFGGSGCDSATGAAGVAPCQYFNPFGSALTGRGTRNSAALLDYLVGFQSVDARSELLTIDGFVTRQLGELAGGPAGIAIGTQYRRDRIESDYDDNANRDNFLFLTGNPDFADRRSVDALFVEFALPLSKTLTLQVADRYETYGNGVDSIDPKVTLLWRPALQFSLRSSGGKSFRAPSLFQSFGTQTTVAELIDPNVGHPQFFPVRTRPNPSGVPLQPETADMLNVGASLSPTERWEIGIDYWSFDYRNLIIEQNPQAVLNASALGGSLARTQVIRDGGSGLLLRVDSLYDNASALRTEGLDLAVRYAFTLAGSGSARVGADATYIARYDLEDPQAGRVDGVGKRNFANFGTSTPQWRVNTFVSWQRGRHSVNSFLRFVDAYSDDQAPLGQGPAFYRRIDSHVTVDAQYSLNPRAARAPTLTFGAINLLDTDPPHVATSGGYDSKVHDPRGRMWYARAVFGF